MEFDDRLCNPQFIMSFLASSGAAPCDVPFRYALHPAIARGRGAGIRTQSDGLLPKTAGDRSTAGTIIAGAEEPIDEIAAASKLAGPCNGARS